MGLLNEELSLAAAQPSKPPLMAPMLCKKAASPTLRELKPPFSPWMKRLPQF